MKTTIKTLKNNVTNSRYLVLLVVALLLTTLADAQFRTYTKVFSDNIKGGTVLFGNTLTQILSNGKADTLKMNDNRANGNSTYGNDNSNIQYVDVDGNSGPGAGTRNSSTADLNLPAGTNTIKLARLYWGGRAAKSDFDITLDTFQRVKIRFGTTGAYKEYKAQQVDKNSVGSGTSLVNQYQAYVDVTPFIQANGSGTYSVGNVAASVGSVGSGGNYAGWCIVVVYENLTSSSYNSVRVYDGFQQVYNGGAAQISSVLLNGLNVPSGPLGLRDAKMGAMVWEGDANLKQDYLKINGTNFYNSLNAIDNPWNGTITDTGVHVTTKNPNFTNQMGIDIDQFYVGNGYGIKPGDSTVALEFGTEADQYFPGLFTFQIKTNDPTVILDKSVTDANKNQIADPNEVLTYTLRGKNIGQGNANHCIVVDTLPGTVTYVPGSMRFVSGTGLAANTNFTDAINDDQADFISAGNVLIFRVGNGASASDGGVLGSLDSFVIEYKVTVNDPGNNISVPPIINVARITGFSDAGVKSTDDGTAILEPLGGPLPVTLVNFIANLESANSVKLNWTTSMEINCKNFEVQRSIDGKNFTSMETVAGSGFTSINHNYTATDDIATVNTSVVYYRLKQVDFDGRASYSKVLSIRLKASTSNFTASPNPFSSQLNINIDWNNNETANIKVINMTGRDMFTKNVELRKGTNYISLNELASLPAGIYIVQLNSSEGSLIKQVSKQ